MTDNSVKSQSFPERMAEHDFGAYDFRNNSMDADDAYRLGKSLSDFYNNKGPVIVGNDHREHSEDIKNALIDGLVDYGTEVDYIGLAPTDLVAYQVSAQEVEGGVAVTASHMPPEYRGLKPLNEEGRIFDEDELEQVFNSYLDFTDNKKEYYSWQTDLKTDWFGESYNLNEKVHEDYISAALDRYYSLFDEDLSGLEVAVDPGNGVGSLTLPRLLKELGVKDDDLYVINQELDPEFSGRGSDPTESDLEGLRSTISREDADLGIALDGDADRAVFVNENAEKILGDESLTILSEKYLQETPDQNNINGVVCSANTSQMLEDWITREPHDGDILGTVNFQPVGAVFTAKHALKNKDTVFGGQPNGHLLDPNFVPYDSGTVAGAVMAGIAHENQGLSYLQDELPSYEITKTDWEVEDKDAAMKVLKDQFGGLNTHGIHRADMNSEKITEAIDLNDKIIFRPSGTEPVIRLKIEHRASSEILNKIKKNSKTLLEK